jgi:uncharacterized phiE125 gp8 family phage protein
MRLTLTTPPAVLPIDKTEMKQHSRIDHDDDDDLIDGLISGVVNYLDGPSGILGRAIMEQAWVLELGEWPATLSLPIEPVTELTVSYLDEDGASQTLAADTYVLDNAPSQASTWRWAKDVTAPALSATAAYPVTFTMVAGAASAEDVDPGLKVAMKMIAAHWYENRETVVVGTSASMVPMAADALLSRYRRHL